MNFLDLTDYKTAQNSYGDALVDCVAACKAQNIRNLYVPSGQYDIDRQANIDFGLRVYGDNQSSSILQRVGGTHVVLSFNSQQSCGVQDLGIVAVEGVGGTAVRSQNDPQVSGMRFIARDCYFSTNGSADWWKTVNLNGQNMTVSPKGNRNVRLYGCNFHGGTNGSLQMWDVVGAAVIGCYVYGLTIVGGPQVHSIQFSGCSLQGGVQGAPDPGNNIVIGSCCST